MIKVTTIAGCAWLMLPVTVLAQGPVKLDAVYTADVSATVVGGVDHAARYLDNLDLMAEADLDSLIGWEGARAFVYVLNNLGHAANNGTATAQGVDNIEVARHGPRLYEAWIELAVAPGITARAGLYDINSEFYATDASGLLLAPPFGIGSELAATGINGPSIFPSTGLAIRLRSEFGSGGYIQAAAVNADARTLGDPGGIDTALRHGVLVLGEAGWGETLRLAAGVWAYTRRQDHSALNDATGNPEQRRARGAYALAQWHMRDRLTLFLRGGMSDGRTSPFRGGFQIGMLQEQIIPGHEDSALSFGMHRAWFSRGYRQVQADAGVVPSKTETALELTLSDRIAPHVTIQPDVQYIFNPGGDAGASNALVTSVRLTFDF